MGLETLRLTVGFGLGGRFGHDAVHLGLSGLGLVFGRGWGALVGCSGVRSKPQRGGRVIGLTPPRKHLRGG